MDSEDIALIGILLACGAITHLVASFFATPLVFNFAISFYCLAIILTTPKIEEALGIGIAAGVIFALVSHSVCPLANLISEPVGAFVCLTIYVLLGRYTSHSASAATFYATCASGFIFILVSLLLAGDVILSQYNSFLAFFIEASPIVLGTALVNVLLTGLLLRLVTRLIIFSELSEF